VATRRGRAKEARGSGSARPRSSFDAGPPGRITIVGPAYPLRGGNALFVAHLYEALRADHDVSVVSFTKLYPRLLFPGRTQLNLSRDPVKATPSRQIIDSANPLTWLRAARWILAPARRPDLVVFVWWNPFFGPCYGTIARALKRGRGPGIAFVCENVVSHENRPIDKHLTRYACSAADYIMVLSGVVARRVGALFPTTPVRQAALPIYDCYRRADHDREATRARLGLRRPTALFFGYVREYKGLSYLLRALPRVLESLEIDLLVVGEFYDDRAPYDRLIDELGIGDHVRIVAEHVPDESVGDYFAASDVAVLPYVSATQSGITQIAYAMGLPVISTDVGGLPEVVRDGETGYIVRPRDAEGLADAVVRYFTDGKGPEFAANVNLEVKRDRAGELLRQAVRDFLEMERAR